LTSPEQVGGKIESQFQGQQQMPSLLYFLLFLGVQDISSYTDDKSGTSLVIQKDQHGKYHIQGIPMPKELKYLYLVRKTSDV